MRRALAVSSLPTLAVCAVLLVCCGVVSAASTRATATRKLIIYSVATGVQYINNADDSARGVDNNPFSKSETKLEPNVARVGNGPFPGDVAVYSFDLYGNGKLKQSSGTASYTCYYNYAKHALCMAYYVLSGGRGTLVASGPVDFDNTHFQLVVTGGTEKYIGASGEVAAASAPKNSQRLQFLLLG